MISDTSYNLCLFYSFTSKCVIVKETTFELLIRFSSLSVWLYDSILLVFSRKFLYTSARNFLLSSSDWLKTVADRIPSDFQVDPEPIEEAFSDTFQNGDVNEIHLEL